MFDCCVLPKKYMVTVWVGDTPHKILVNEEEYLKVQSLLRDNPEAKLTVKGTNE